jgi:hypothetical protein
MTEGMWSTVIQGRESGPYPDWDLARALAVTTSCTSQIPLPGNVNMLGIAGVATFLGSSCRPPPEANHQEPPGGSLHCIHHSALHVLGRAAALWPHCCTQCTALHCTALHCTALWPHCCTAGEPMRQWLFIVAIVTSQRSCPDSIGLFPLWRP